MGSITTGIGLISGLDTATLIDQLMSIEARPRTLVQQRVAILQSQKTAFLEINSRLLALQSAASAMGLPSLFNTKQTTSSNSAALTATASNSAASGVYQLIVNRLVSTQQLITKGFANTSSSVVASDTSLTFDSYLARLDRDVKLSALNGSTGV